jgi:phospholipid/cholesterol/gamma-HCH transport system ATP-binding protein
LTGSLELIEISDLHFSWQDRVVLDGIDLSIPRGKVTVIMGPSGAGKTTLLQLIGGRLQPASGIVLVDGHSVPDLRRGALFELRKRIGMLFQSGALLTDLDVFENVAFPLREHSALPEPVIRQLVLMKLQLVGLRGARRLMPAQLSGGMARRVALARAIVMDPMMVMYDEPFTGLDPISRGVIVKLIRTLNDKLGITSLVVTHDVSEAMSIADRIHLLSHGRFVASGTPQELMASASEEVTQFMQGRPEGPVHFHYPADDYLDDLFGVQP